MESDEWKKYCKKRFGRVKLPAPKKKPTIAEVVAEGNDLLKEDLGKQLILDKKSKKGTVSSKNPYIKARNKILTDIGELRRKEILKMEKEGRTEHRIYKEFIKMVVSLGDQFSDKK